MKGTKNGSRKGRETQRAKMCDPSCFDFGSNFKLEIETEIDTVVTKAVILKEG